MSHYVVIAEYNRLGSNHAPRRLPLRAFDEFKDAAAWCETRILDLTPIPGVPAGCVVNLIVYQMSPKEEPIFAADWEFGFDNDDYKGPYVVDTRN